MNEKTESTSSFFGELRDAAARNPVSAALIGMGVLWMLTGAKSPAGAGECSPKCRPRPYSGHTRRCPVGIKRKSRFGSGRCGYRHWTLHVNAALRPLITSWTMGE